MKAQGERGEVREGLRGDPPLMGALDIILFHAGHKPSEIRIMLKEIKIGNSMETRAFNLILFCSLCFCFVLVVAVSITHRTIPGM